MRVAYNTDLGQCLHGKIEQVLTSPSFRENKGKVQLVFTSPPFPLNTKKKYGNKNGRDYITWLTKIMSNLGDYLSSDGSLVVEIGNAWETHEPTMSTLPLETLLSIKNKGKFRLCQQFVWFNTAKLPSPAQWVTVDRVRVKDSFTNIWWLSRSSTPKANNKRVLDIYSDSMVKLLKNQKYNAGLRPSQHKIGEESFLKDHGGAIPANVLVAANTGSAGEYLKHCKENNIPPHPARMPPYLAEFFIKFLTEESDLVLDPFAGSNTTGEVSERLHRRWIAVEAKEEYNDGSRVKFKTAARCEAL